MEKRKIAYAYIKSSKYYTYHFSYDGDDDTKEIQEDFDNLDSLLRFAYVFSNFNSIPIQFYY